MNPFLVQNTIDRSTGSEKAENQQFSWLISADKIFESQIKDYKEYARFFYMEFEISRFSLFDGKKSSDSAVCSKDVRIYLPPSRFCAVIQGNLASGKEISKIILKKVEMKSGILEAVEEKEFTNCIIQSFDRKGEVASFSFRYTGYSDSYQDFDSDGKKSGKAATKIDLTTWKVS